MILVNNKPRTICKYCGQEHEVLELYVQRVAHLEKVLEVELIECYVTNMKYVRIKQKAYVLN